MNGQRRVVRTARGVYGRSVPLASPSKRRVRFEFGWTVSQRLRRLAILLVVAGVLAGAGIWLVSVRSVQVRAADQQDTITKDIWQHLNDGWWPANLVTLDEAALESAIREVHPVVKDLQFKRQWPSTLVVTAELKSPQIVWYSGSQLAVLDADGTAIGGMSAADAKLPVVYDGSNLPVEPGQQVVRAQFVTYIHELTTGLASRGVGINKLRVGQTTLDLTVETNKTYQLIFDTSRLAGEGLRDYDAVIKSATNLKKPINEYIDLRISGKAYYK